MGRKSSAGESDPYQIHRLPSERSETEKRRRADEPRIAWLLLWLCLVWSCAPLQAQESAARAKVPPSVRVAYLVPSDRVFQSDYRTAVEHAIENVQVWYQTHAGSAETFQLSHPTATVVRTSHPASYYATNPVSGADGSLWFWFNALADAFSATGAEFFDPDRRWVFYIDADVACGQVIGAAAGVALNLPIRAVSVGGSADWAMNLAMLSGWSIPSRVPGAAMTRRSCAWGTSPTRTRT